MEQLSDAEKVRVASDFIRHAPPGEFNEVFNDVRILLNNDDLLKDGASGSFAQYNKEQFVPSIVEGAAKQVLITEHGDLGHGRFLDPRSKTSFKFDHLRKEASDVRSSEVDSGAEPLRAELELQVDEYVQAHYKNGVATVYAQSESDGIAVTVCVENHQYQPKNFWNGRWRSQWSVTVPHGSGSAELVGLLRVQVHYYEDGNVQLVSSKEVKESIVTGSDTDTAKAIVKVMNKAEGEYQESVNENYTNMSDTTFKALRRKLPVTRTLLDWNKIVGYRIGAELKNA